jgi:uncharacterized membrane protein YphA (DoxX/SURF4 family)
LPRPPSEPSPGGRGIGGLSLASRLVFAAVLLPWFLVGGASRIAGLAVSVGPAVGVLPLSLGAFHAYLPGSVADLSSGLPEVAFSLQAYVAAMVLLELALPLMIVAGWWARVAAPLLMLHQLAYWLGAQPWSEAGAAFDASPFEMIPDQLLLWAMLLAPIALFGAGPLSIDACLSRRRRRRGRPPPH